MGTRMLHCAWDFLVERTAIRVNATVVVCQHDRIVFLSSHDSAPINAGGYNDLQVVNLS